MPDTTIGRHAVQHIEYALEWHARVDQQNADRRAAPGRDPQAALAERQVRAILEAGRHAALNAGLRRLADRQVVRPGAAPSRLIGPRAPASGGR